MYLGERGEQERGVVIVDAFHVALGVAGSHEGGDGLGRDLLQFAECLVGEVFGAVDARSFGNDFERPDGLEFVDLLVFDGFEESGSGKMEGQVVVALEDRELDGLGVDVEMVLAERDHVAAADEELLAVAELADGVLADRLQAALEVVGFDRVAEIEELGDDVAEAIDHLVARVERVDGGDVFERADAVGDALEQAVGDGLERGGATVSGVDEGELFALEGGLDLGAFLREVDEVVVESGEAALELLDLNHEAAEEFVALVGRVAALERIRHGLTDEPKLGGELGRALGRLELADLLAETGEGLVQARVDGRDALDDAGGLGGVGDVEIADDLDEELELGAGLFDAFLEVAAFDDFGDFRGGGFEFRRALAVGLEGGVGEEKLDAVGGELVGFFGDRPFQLVDRGEVGVAQVAERDELAAGGAELGQGTDVGVDGVEFAGEQSVEELRGRRCQRGRSRRWRGGGGRGLWRIRRPCGRPRRGGRRGVR